MVGLIVGLTSDVPDQSGDSQDLLYQQDHRTFIGVARCKTCHRKPASGEQFRIWEESAHSKAYATLASEESKAIAAKKGIDDPQTAESCLKCHATGAGVAAEALGPKHDIADGVGCESCHGPGQDYYKKSTMVLIYKGELDPESVGLVVPTEATC
ncbi:MAG TPA: cytochrome c family protein, partial [Rhodothermales bacterium]|nr:cytochrome c family protein [Rhodothermales bacterium]